MISHFKPHILELTRYQTSLGRDLEEGIRLDRNERVSPFSEEEIRSIFGMFRNYSLSASPEADFLYKRLADYLGIEEKRIFITNGVTEGIRVLYDFCTYPGDNVICLDPTYPMYKVYAEMYGLEYRRFTYDETSLRPNVATLYDQLDDKTKFVFIPNPNLPVESCFGIEEIGEFAEACKKNNSMLVVDEAYHYFGGPSTLDLVKKYDNFVVFRSFSKAYGLAGLRIGFMVGGIQFIDYISKSRSLVESNTLSMQIAEYFLSHSELRDRHVEEVKKGSLYLQQELDRLGLRWHGGNYTNGILIFLHSKNEADHVVSYLKERHIYIRGSFGPPFSSCIRVSIGSRPYMERFVSTLKEWLVSHPL